MAAKDLLPWQEVVQDRAVVVAPLTRVCLGCLGSLAETSTPCTSCGWPLCSSECRAEGHRLECGVLRKAGVRPQDEATDPYTVLSVLRVLLLQQEEGGEAWRRVQGLESHWEQFDRDPGLVEGMKGMTDFLQHHLGLSWVLEQDVQHCFGVLKTNAMGVSDQGGQALYPLASIMSHSCVSNLDVIGEPGQTVRFRAKRKIEEGEELTIRYHMFLAPRDQIRADLENQYHFSCSCPRCSDQSELGTHFSSLQCTCSGFFSSRVPHQPDLHLCSSCSDTKDLSSQLARVAQLSEQLDEQGYSPQLEAEVLGVPGCHPSFHLRIQLHLAFLGSGQPCPAPREVVARATVVLHTLRLLEGGCSQLLARCTGLAALALYLKLLLFLLLLLQVPWCPDSRRPGAPAGAGSPASRPGPGGGQGAVQESGAGARAQEGVLCLEKYNLIPSLDDVY